MKEVHRIDFVGNETFSDKELLNVISSESTDLSIPHQIIKYYYDNLSKIPETPKYILKGFSDNLERMSYEKRYFIRETAESDVISLWHYYNQHGFHQPSIDYAFVPDTALENNTLYFYITQGPRYKIDTVKYVGLDSVSTEVLDKIIPKIEDRSDDYFFEGDIKKDAQLVRNTLLNNGYYFADFATPVVIKDTVSLLDSVLVFFSPGKRVVYGEISYIDERNGQPAVSLKKKKKQITFEPGEYYSRRDVAQSIENLLTLGTFSVVSVDTFNVESAPNDTTLPFRVFTVYKEQQDVGAGLFVNQTEVDKLWNAGVEATYLHRNIFGGAQTLELRGSVSTKEPWDRISELWRNIPNDPSRTKLTEWSIGATLTEPTLFEIQGTPFSGSFSPLVANRLLHGFFNLRVFNFPFKFTAKFPSWTLVNRAVFDLIFEKQDPVHFDKSLLFQKAQNSDKLLEAIRAKEAIELYENLYNYLHPDKNHWLTANLLGVQLISEHRNNLFAPTKGHYSSFAVDGINPLFWIHNTYEVSQLAGAARYYRAQLSHYHFFNLQPNLVFAVKGRYGKIWHYADSNSYVPIERQFFAGGANSNRGWWARRLRYEELIRHDSVSSYIYDFIEDFIGSKILIETSYELRYRFKREGMVEGIYVTSLSPWGLTAFIDAGNTFGWFYDVNADTTLGNGNSAKNYDLKWYEYITKLSVAIGGGITYQTPVGPVRFDVALPFYGRFNGDFQTILSRGNLKLDDLRFHLGLGHAF